MEELKIARLDEDDYYQINAGIKEDDDNLENQQDKQKEYMKLLGSESGDGVIFMNDELSTGQVFKDLPKG